MPVPAGGVAFSVEETLAVADRLAVFPLVVKAQIHAGGRGRGGGVRVVRCRRQVSDAAQDILGMKLVTRQTGAAGRLVQKVLVEQGVDIRDELYLSILHDRQTASVMIMASIAGGMNIEEVAEQTPAEIVRVRVNPLTGIQPFHCRRVAFGLGLSPVLIKQFVPLLTNLYTLFTECDCTLVEINPLVISGGDLLIALDAKIDIDSSALFRHADIAALRDTDEEEPLEVEAAASNLNYIKLQGNVGNMVNGAGLAMATMDIIKKAGAEPANFLDVGGGANAAMVEKGFRIILRDPDVKVLLINIFGGILRCDVLAEGVVEAAAKVDMTVPVVIRMEGTNVEKGRKILAESGLNLLSAVDLADAAAKVASCITVVSEQ